ncbi:hypothetical protein ACJMK2_004330 [Sinanodonta woodiana]|uniref:Peptidase M12B domain-containing protein n=1 Tax=Sinanodonta woodiana TaxID=1069815 RepID=A0ABD3Y202_SINWO
MCLLLEYFHFRILCLQKDASFPHIISKVLRIEGKKRIEAGNYLYDIGVWANKTTDLKRESYDHVMLFTRHLLFDRIRKTFLNGMSEVNGVCNVLSQVSVVHLYHYAQAVKTAAHELGHNLGADHDGEGDSRACKSEDSFIMSSRQKMLSKTLRYIDNIWKFSNCSVESFHTKLKNKNCVKTPGPVFNMDEWTMFMTNEAGYVFTPAELCYLHYGPGSKFTGELSKEICYLLHCKDPVTKIHTKAYINAARGTKCGDNKWCIDGRCVPKDSN